MCGQDHGRGPAPIPEPAAHIARLIDPHVRQSDLAKQFRDARPARSLGAGRCRRGGERGLAREGHVVGALDVTAGGADALVREQARDEVVHGLVSAQCSPKPHAASGLTAASLES